MLSLPRKNFKKVLIFFAIYNITLHNKPDFVIIITSFELSFNCCS